MLHLKDVKKSFTEPDGGVLPILDVAEFCVAAGEQMVLVGRSGCGKTTLLHVIAGISRPDSGKVRINAGISPSCRRPSATASGPSTSATCFRPSTFSAASRPWKTSSWPCALPAAEPIARGRNICWSASGSAIACTISRRPFRSASNSGWRWLGRWPIVPSCCWPTSPRPTSIPAISSRYSISCAIPVRRSRWPCCWSPTARSWRHGCRGSINPGTYSTARCPR